MVSLEVISNPVELEVMGEPPVLLEIITQTIELEMAAKQGIGGRDGRDGIDGRDGAQTTSLPWESITGKPDVLEDSEIIDGGNF